MNGYDTDPEAIKVMVKAGYMDFDEMNPEQQAFAQAQCGMMLYALTQAGWKVTKEN